MNKPLLCLLALPLLVTSAWSEDRPKVELRSEIISISKTFSVGKPMLFRLEGQNMGGPAVFIDMQALEINRYSFKVVDAKGKPVPCVAPSEVGHQTMEDLHPIGPGKPKALIESFDLAGGFAIYEPGTYTVSFKGVGHVRSSLKPGEITISANGAELNFETVFGGLPASKSITFEVKRGKLSRQQTMLKQLRPAMPKDWVLCRDYSDDGVVLGNHGEQASVWTNLQPMKNRKALPETYALLGKGKTGWIAMKTEINGIKGNRAPPPNASLETFWPEATDQIRKALQISTP